MHLLEKCWFLRKKSIQNDCQEKWPLRNNKRFQNISWALSINENDLFRWHSTVVIMFHRSRLKVWCTLWYFFAFRYFFFFSVFFSVRYFFFFSVHFFSYLNRLMAFHCGVNWWFLWDFHISFTFDVTIKHKHIMLMEIYTMESLDDLFKIPARTKLYYNQLLKRLFGWSMQNSFGMQTTRKDFALSQLWEKCQFAYDNSVCVSHRHLNNRCYIDMPSQDCVGLVCVN